jgi:hypothetical protein
MVEKGGLLLWWHQGFNLIHELLMINNGFRDIIIGSTLSQKILPISGHGMGCD